MDFDYEEDFEEYFDDDDFDEEDKSETKTKGATSPTNPVTPVSPVNPPETKYVEKEEEEEIKEKHNPTIPFFILFGEHVDMDTAVIAYIVILMWIAIWYFTGLIKSVGKDILFTIIFVIFILYMMLNVKTSGTSSGGVVYELNILLTVEQMVSILLGTMVLFTLFADKLNVHQNCRIVIQKSLLSILIILTFCSLWVNVFTSGRAFRAVRKFKQGVYNVSLMLFVLVCLTFIRGNKFPEICDLI